MKTFMFYMVMAYSLFITSTVSAAPCGEVLYVAYASLLFMNEDRYNEKWNAETIEVPLYMGVICVDTVKKELAFYPKYADFPFNHYAGNVVGSLNDKRFRNFQIEYKPRYDNLGEGESYWYPYFSFPKNGRLFAYWAKEALNYREAYVIRREVNAEPDLEWAPQFTYPRRKGEERTAPPEAVFAWTDAQGRAGGEYYAPDLFYSPVLGVPAVIPILHRDPADLVWMPYRCFRYELDKVRYCCGVKACCTGEWPPGLSILE